MTVAECAPGAVVRLRRVAARNGRLRELGFVPGAVLRVLARGGTGGLIVAIGDARMAVDREIAHVIHVEPVTGPATPAVQAAAGARPAAAS
ncbi:FeoA family protein [Actinomadura harenae]|uniref:Ferrous iron transport protein A n=1 Tax=Actinomadura harenae TaxID=2483351 RepID=A0A3M2LKE3_9ACTN|nr:FeoA family protein [Actinomadura harenae]RMI37952.1 ferrous iron transport protein A [Actinomadura harenae]